MKTKLKKAIIVKKEINKLLKEPIKKAVKRVKRTSFSLGDLVSFNCCSKKKSCIAVIIKKEIDYYTVLNMHVCIVCVEDGAIKPNSTTENESEIMVLL